MPLDPSISLQVGQGVPAPANPLVMAGQAAGLANTVANNRQINAGADQTEQTLGVNRQNALGRLALQAAQYPETSVENGQTVYPMMNAAHTAIGHAVRSKLITMEEGNQLVQNLASSQNSGHARDMLLSFAERALTPSEQYSAVVGTPYTADIGDKQVSGVQQPTRFGGGRAPTTAIGMTMTPAQSIITQDVPEMGPDNQPTGRTTKVTNAQLAQRLGMFNGSNLSNTPVDPNQKFPPQLLNPNKPMPTPAAQPQAQPSGNLGTIRSPDDVAQIQRTKLASADAFQKIIDEGVVSRTRASTLGGLLTESQGFTSGAGSDSIKKIGSLLISRFPDQAKALGLDANSISSREGFDKMVAQIQQDQGAGSDARLVVNQSSFPTSQISPEGMRSMFIKLQGNEDYKQARGKLAQSETNKGDISQFENKASVLDPRAFQYQRMSTPQRRDYMDNLKKTGDTNSIKKIMNAYDFAEKNNLFGGG